MSGENVPGEVFADTCVLLNFVQREWEYDRSTALIESETVGIVVSQNVLEELSDVASRRRDIYADLVDFLNETEAAVEEYDPSDRRVYIGDNDANHVRRLQEQLAALDTKREALRRLRRFTRAASSRVEYLESTLSDAAIDPVPPLDLRFAVDRLLDHDADTRVVTDAATWTAGGGSGILVTIDGDDLFEHQEQLVDLLIEKQGPRWAIDIVLPDNLSLTTQLSESAE